MSTIFFRIFFFSVKWFDSINFLCVTGPSKTISVQHSKCSGWVVFNGKQTRSTIIKTASLLIRCIVWLSQRKSDSFWECHLVIVWRLLFTRWVTSYFYFSHFIIFLGFWKVGNVFIALILIFLVAMTRRKVPNVSFRKLVFFKCVVLKIHLGHADQDLHILYVPNVSFRRCVFFESTLMCRSTPPTAWWLACSFYF